MFCQQLFAYSHTNVVNSYHFNKRTGKTTNDYIFTNVLSRKKNYFNFNQREKLMVKRKKDSQGTSVFPRAKKTTVNILTKLLSREQSTVYMLTNVFLSKLMFATVFPASH